MTDKTTNNQPILLVDDNDEDVEITLRAFKKSGLANQVFRCKDGDEALDFLFQRGEFSEPGKAPRPGIILLDLNMPDTDGREVLEAIKNSPELKKIPVIVLTTSSDERDIEDCYEMGANSYVQKPVNLAGYMEAIQRMKDYWFKVVIIPSPNRQG